jgi:hypothetical protein
MTGKLQLRCADWVASQTHRWTGSSRPVTVGLKVVRAHPGVRKFDGYTLGKSQLERTSAIGKS